MALRLQVVTPTGQAFDDDVAEVLIPTTSGVIGVLPKHTDLTTVVKLGIISIRKNKEDGDNAMDHFVVTPGIAEIGSTHVRILVDEADHAASLDEHEINQQMAEAREKLRSAQDKTEIAQVTSTIERSAMRLEATKRARR